MTTLLSLIFYFYIYQEEEVYDQSERLIPSILSWLLRTVFSLVSVLNLDLKWPNIINLTAHSVYSPRAVIL